MCHGPPPPPPPTTSRYHSKPNEVFLADLAKVIGMEGALGENYRLLGVCRATLVAERMKGACRHRLGRAEPMPGGA